LSNEGSVLTQDMKICCLRLLCSWTIYHTHVIADGCLSQFCSRGLDCYFNTSSLDVESKGATFAVFTVYTNLTTL